MNSRNKGLHPAWWTAILIACIAALVFVTSALFAGWFRSYVPVTVTVTSERSGLVMEPGAKVKMRGVVVGRVDDVVGGPEPVRIKLELDPDIVEMIPANVTAQIRATTAFGAKYVDLVPPLQDPSPDHIQAGAVLQSTNVATEVNTVFESLTNVLGRIQPEKLNAILGALAEGVRGKGERIGEATTDLNEVLLAVNPRMDTVRADFQALAAFSDAYGAAAQDLLTVLDAASTTSETVSAQAANLNSLLVSAVGFGTSGANLLAAAEDPLVRALNVLEPTTALLNKYQATVTCTLQGAEIVLTEGGYDAVGGNRRTTMLDSGLLLGDDPYLYPDNLPIIAAKGGPGGAPNCGSLPETKNNYPVRALVTNTGWGTGPDIREHPGLGRPWWMNFLPVTRAVPEPPSVRGQRPPGPIPVQPLGPTVPPENPPLGETP